MKLYLYYIQLYSEYATIDLEPFTATRAQLSECFSCSERNAIYILNQLEDMGWIKRKRGNGRGNVTKINLIKSLKDALSEILELKQRPKSEEVEQILHCLEKNDLGIEFIQYFVNQFFGISKEITEEQEIDVLTIPYFRTFHSLDPVDAERQTEKHLVKQIFDTLLLIDEDNQIHSSIAYHWEVDKDHFQWTFYIRKGVLFHNNRELTSQDVAFTLNRLRNTPSRWMVECIEEVHCVSKYIVKINLNHENFLFPYILGSQQCSIVPYQYGGLDKRQFSYLPIGTGPYKVKKNNDEGLGLRVHTAYFKERAHIDSIDLQVVPSVEKYLNLHEQKINPFLYVPFTISNDEQKDYQHIQRKNLSIKYVIWNMTKKQIRENSNLRKILFKQLNKDLLIKDLGYPRGESCHSFLGHSQKNTYSICDKPITLEEPLVLLTYDHGPSVEDAEWIQKECEKLGVPINLSITPYESLMESTEEADLMICEYVPDDYDELTFLHLLKSEQSLVADLAPYLKTKELANQVTHQKLRETRLELLCKIEGELIDSAIVFPLYTTYQTAIFHENLMGVAINSFGLVSFRDLYLRAQGGFE